MPIEVVYERRGRGTPLVLLHGIGHRWQAWEPVLDRLAGHHDVIAVDLPGFGASPLVADREYTMPAAVAMAAEMFESFGLDRPHVAGNSLGGVLALELASQGLVSSATALAPAGFWNAGGRAWALGLLTVLRLTGRAPGWLRTAFVHGRPTRLLAAGMLFGKPARLSAEMVLADLDAFVGCTAFDLVARAGRDYTFASPAPTVPVTVGWGTRDRILWPRQARRAAELLPGAEHVLLTGCGHIPMGDDPDRVAGLIIDTCARTTLDTAA
ncbi:alpha/beta hydrolase [Actinophytocola sp.]|uniref:alpha/beta fold hydrolase n=1 Tax=Actinophytocola sp. TaxID=1872138 RepID=UPI002D7F344F|nr:alpha/beta hydrolase [Actinophytocola sp.]HET9139302.1 alpha/beta hydrolase [Actinophytocola sp.]HEU5107691.1 alpha/beta hydrolase [Micromonosporaceae bacterium]